MQERSEKRFLHHFLRGRRGDWDEMPEGKQKTGFRTSLFYLSEIKAEEM